MLGSWLDEVPHPVVPTLDPYIADEVGSKPAGLVDYLAERMVTHRTSLEVIREMTSILGWSAAERRLVPSTVQLQRGDFGEMLAIEAVEHFGGLVVPVRKVRYQIHASDSQVGADFLAFEMDGTEVVRIHLGEVKLRTTRDTTAGADAHDQLVNWLAADFADVILFVGARLESSDRPLYEAFIRYLSDVGQRDDQYHIVLVWETGAWTDDVLSRIPEPPDLLEPMTTRTIRVDELAQLIDAVYTAVRDLVDD